MNDILLTDIQYLSGVGPARACLFESELGISTFGDLIRFYPYRYVDRSVFTPISKIDPDMPAVQFKAKVSRINAGAKKFSVYVTDATAEIELVFFKGIKYVSSKLRPDTEWVFMGKPVQFGNVINIVHPEIDAPSICENAPFSMNGVYSSTQRLHNSGITNKVFAKLIRSALDRCLPAIGETLPAYILKDRGLMDLRNALLQVHFPTDPTSLSQARRRLKFEELLIIELSLLKQKFVRTSSSNGLVFSRVGDNFHACYNALPYPLTGAQKRVIREIREDMRSTRQMNRLLQGDVGSGKTMVAVLSALIAVDNGYQACIMAPTEVLAQQHFANISKYLAPCKAKVALLTGSTPQSERKAIHEGLMDGSISMLVGTHALLEDNVQFNNLGLAVIDEQHRFGVDQRSRLWQKGRGGAVPHVLVMTATPIPRTLAMTLYGDLDVSVIDEMPPGRKPILTKHIYESGMPGLYAFMRDEIAKGRQVFVVYPLICESEKLDYQNLERGYENMMKAFPYPDYTVAYVHGRQSPQEKQGFMEKFASGEADILVATSVIEVGVDVPNASVMVIQSAERFGLSQLHQLRGRVGRGCEKSYCILVTGVKLSKESRNRIELMCRTENGFTLADEDLKMRGPGDLEGTAQSGLPIELKIASLTQDTRLLAECNECASRILQSDPTLSLEVNALLKSAVQSSKIMDYSKIS